MTELGHDYLGLPQVLIVHRPVAENARLSFEMPLPRANESFGEVFQIGIVIFERLLQVG